MNTNHSNYLFKHILLLVISFFSVFWITLALFPYNLESWSSAFWTWIQNIAPVIIFYPLGKKYFNLWSELNWFNRFCLVFLGFSLLILPMWNSFLWSLNLNLSLPTWLNFAIAWLALPGDFLYISLVPAILLILFTPDNSLSELRERNPEKLLLVVLPVAVILLVSSIFIQNYNNDQFLFLNLLFQWQNIVLAVILYFLFKKYLTKRFDLSFFYQFILITSFTSFIFLILHAFFWLFFSGFIEKQTYSVILILQVIPKAFFYLSALMATIFIFDFKKQDKEKKDWLLMIIFLFSAFGIVITVTNLTFAFVSIYNNTNVILDSFSRLLDNLMPVIIFYFIAQNYFYAWEKLETMAREYLLVIAFFLLALPAINGFLFLLKVNSVFEGYFPPWSLPFYLIPAIFLISFASKNKNYFYDIR